MRRMGVVLSPYGVPRSGLAVTVRNWATGALVTTATTNANGRWEVDLPDETIQYWVEVAGGAPSLQKAVQTPASVELEYEYIRFGSKAGPAAVIDYSGAAGVTLPANVAIGGQTLDARYVEQAGDTMTGPLNIDYNGDGFQVRRAGTLGAVIRGYAHRGTLAAPTDNAAGDTVRYDMASGRTTGAMQDVYRSMVTLASATGGKARGDWTLDLADGAGTLTRRITLTGLGDMTLAGPLTMTGALAQSGGYAYLGAWNTGAGLYPRVGGDLAVGFNFAAGLRDMTFWNTDTNNTPATNISFAFRQLLAGNTRRDQMTIMANGAVFLTGPTEVRTDGARALAVRNAAGTLSFGVEPDGTLRGRPIANSAVLSGGVYGHIPFQDKESGTTYYIPLYRP